mmetsp:Transcript_67466/g.140985  ORF Transcript_67466/g.140985 Transcript_67466/m.140985 type:complete len:348 (+) Transcript_67466:278-1321(+)|eukprot:CAMPEP_0206539910 /NCGR_PEP_ID=MMETSP0325_2-20121206/8687_1 /ASSEMBLY_ACC=CAM_ASM_000347 /TAXON_ID=2866 /ORGANISM="Crypthecodinium cohnii, Strain Seligo" /LENGTH=347 /DNA_ID=CAMNT_0054037525 /DNA_START=213 /DNA_END=1256 /DNA_ORIENTATION=-
MFKTERWTLANILPVAFILWIIGTLWFVYLFFHLMDLFAMESAKHRASIEAFVSQFLTLILLVCLLRAIFTDPGSVPDTAVWKKKMKWGVDSDCSDQNEEIHQYEVKADGQPRFCKWCDQYKPDRCHHCRVCRSCILRMDHHCPWIANCVGFANHKFFFLVVFYALLNTLFIIFTMSESVTRAITEECSPRKRFLIIFAMTLASIMTILLSLFFSFHCWLMVNATTTIEFCEKTVRKGEGNLSYDLGVFHNMKAVLGPNPLFWLLPTAMPSGDGLQFEVRRKEGGKGGGSASSGPKGAAKQHGGDLDAFLLNKDEPGSSAGPSKEAAASTSSAAEAPEVTGKKAAAV